VAITARPNQVSLHQRSPAAATPRSVATERLPAGIWLNTAPYAGQYTEQKKKAQYMENTLGMNAHQLAVSGARAVIASGHGRVTADGLIRKAPTNHRSVASQCAPADTFSH
jgi:hypothetical protein